MHELTTIGDYEVRVIGRVGAVVRYAATHVVLPRRAVVELLDLDAPRVDAMRLMTVSAALAKPDAAPDALTRLLARMLAADPAMRPTASEVVTAARACRDAIGFIDDDEPILLERRRVPTETVIVDLEACG
jgi:hypothetical protein